LRKNGCYADSGPLALHWNAVSAGTRGTDWSTFCTSIASLPDAQLWRHNQAGDLPHVAGTIDAAAVAQLVDANRGKRGFTYTHHVLTDANLSTIAAANAAGFTVNLSADDLDECDSMIDTGLPVVVLLPADQKTNTVTPRGRKVIVCPATIRDDVSCATCQMCARADRGQTAIGFPAHGSGAKKATAIAIKRIS
jgi:hypothetical protein